MSSVESQYSYIKECCIESMRHKQDAIKVKTGALGNNVAEMKNLTEGLKGKIEQVQKISNRDGPQLGTRKKMIVFIQKVYFLNKQWFQKHIQGEWKRRQYQRSSVRGISVLTSFPTEREKEKILKCWKEEKLCSLQRNRSQNGIELFKSKNRILQYSGQCLQKDDGKLV